jgi:predicted acetyltransferase
MQLIRPTIDYQDSFLEALKEFQSEGRNLDLNFDDLSADFEGYTDHLLGLSDGKNLKPEYVPETVFWLVDDGVYIGKVAIRHNLTESLMRVGGHIGYEIRPTKRMQGYGSKILELAIPEAKKLNLEKVLITCDETNIGSRKIIENNGGVLENIEEQEEGKPQKLRFWITLK